MPVISFKNFNIILALHLSFEVLEIMLIQTNFSIFLSECTHTAVPLSHYEVVARCLAGAGQPRAARQPRQDRGAPAGRVHPPRPPQPLPHHPPPRQALLGRRQHPLSGRDI